MTAFVLALFVEKPEKNASSLKWDGTLMADRLDFVFNLNLGCKEVNGF
jgi:hypothetical protein